MATKRGFVLLRNLCMKRGPEQVPGHSQEVASRLTGRERQMGWRYVNVGGVMNECRDAQREALR
jgi:hypothetical protein